LEKKKIRRLIMLRSIKYCYDNKLIASFYCNQNDTNGHLTGYIEKYNESEILIAHISMHGYYDGFILKHIEDIYRIDYGGEYEQKIENLYVLKKQTSRHIDTFCEDDSEILYSLLDYAKENNVLVSLEFYDNFISGLINGYDDGIVYLSIINEYGVEKGVSIINVDEVDTVCVDTDDEQDLKILYECTQGDSSFVLGES